MLRAGLLTQLESLRLTPKRWMRGPRRGDLLSPTTGGGSEFVEHRAYDQGDDVRHIDWHVAARTDEYYVKLYQGEHNVYLDILLDHSASMDYGDPHKLTYAARVAAALAYIGLHNGHHVQIHTYAQGITSSSPPWQGRAQAVHMFRYLTAVAPGGATSLAQAASDYTQRPPRPGVTFILSDLYDTDRGPQGMTSLQQAGRDLYLLHTLSPQEWQPPVAGSFEWRDAETGDMMEITLDEGTALLYEQARNEWQHGLRSLCHQRGMRYIAVDTATSINQLIFVSLRREGVVG